VKVNSSSKDLSAKVKGDFRNEWIRPITDMFHRVVFFLLKPLRMICPGVGVAVGLTVAVGVGLEAAVGVGVEVGVAVAVAVSRRGCRSNERAQGWPFAELGRGKHSKAPRAKLRQGIAHYGDSRVDRESP
jgi:hypothetical protein